mgnify:CR=1 FL=1
MRSSAETRCLVLVLLTLPTPGSLFAHTARGLGDTVGRGGSCRTGTAVRLCSAEEQLAAEDSVVDAASFLQPPTCRPRSGNEAFADTTWSVLMQMNEGGSTIFTVQLLEDFTCRFSDSELLGSWECKGEWVVLEKPKGLFELTLFFSAKLAPPTEDRYTHVTRARHTTALTTPARHGPMLPQAQMAADRRYGAEEQCYGGCRRHS